MLVLGAQQNGARDCRGDIYYVDVPIWAAAPSLTPAAFRAQLTASLQTSLQVSWFCGSDGATCTDPATVTSVVASVTPVLAQRTVPGLPWRDDGHKRFYRVSFFASNDPLQGPLWARPSKTCELVQQLRASAVAVVPGTPLWVGRDCEASGHGDPAEGNPSNEMLDWHLTRLGVPTQAQPASNVDLVLIDSGVDPLARPHLQLTQSRSFGTTASLHPHGSGMASLIRSIAKRTALYDLRVLRDDGHGTSAPLAQALDFALFDIKSRRPMIINLSLGWPRVYSEYTELSPSNCSTWEDPSGEAVRYLIHGSALTDRATIFAAAGNDPTNSHPHVGDISPPPGVSSPPACAQLSQRAPWFYPAQWDHTPSCFTTGQETRSVIAVSGTNDREQRSAVAVPMETPLVAPSDHVYAIIPGVPANSADNCPANIGVRGVESPQVFSGSSVSTALVSAAAARAQELRLGSRQNALSSSQIEKLLYLTGEALCRTNGDGTPIRRLHVGRLESIFQTPNCVASLLTCSAAGQEVGSTTLSSCTTAVETTCALGPAAGTCPLDQEALSWPSLPATACDGDFNITPLLEACNPTLCPVQTQPNRMLLGGTGPQPNTGGCPDCLLSQSATAWTFHAELSSNFPLGTSFEDPVIEFIAPNGEISLIKLIPLTPASAWFPGAKLKITIPPTTLAPVGTPKQVKARLLLTILQAGVSGTDYSALRVASEL
jgi:hypothetical protein